MNLFIHGLDGKIELGNSYTDDKHATLRGRLRAGQSAVQRWHQGRKRLGRGYRSRQRPAPEDSASEQLPLSPRNANTMWMLHFLYPT